MAYLFILCAVALVLLYNGFVRYQRLARNISLAKATGLPYKVSPIDTFGVYWLATRHLWLSLLHRLLPQSCKGLWLDLLNPEWAHRVGHKPFAEAGSDVFFMASPGRLTAFVADAEVIAQITTRRNDFPKPLEMYGRLDLFGKNLVSTEGADWRMHRKLTAPSFGERNNELVFSESVHNTQSLLRLWTGPSGTESRVVADPAEDIMRWALYIISGAGFDIQVTWPHEEGLSQAEKTNDDSLVFKGLQIPPGHKMNYRDALSELLNNIVWSFMGPPEYLSKSPFKAHRAIGTAMMEWRQYMEEIFQMKKDQVASGQGAHGMDLFQSLIRGSGILEGRNTNVKKSDIIGNAFVLMLAGHETTSNTLHYALIYLAMHWSSQKRLQEEIDQVIQGRATQDWKYDELISKLFNGMPAAVMNETLRIITPINNIPKSTAPGCPQEFTMGGRRYTMPGGTHVSLSAAVHTNPKYWPAPKGEEVKNGIPDVLRFRPERWLANSQTSNDSVNVPYDDEDLGGSSGEDTSSLLFKPVKGSFIPFSDGFRSCIGRRFSQVEFLAAFAVIFSRYSVELAVDQWVSDAELEKMPEGGKEREAAWKKAADRAWRLLRENTDSVITLQLRGHTIPIRLVERGHEMLKFDY